MEEYSEVLIIKSCKSSNLNLHELFAVRDRGYA
jgi:hypothetical protein